MNTKSAVSFVLIFILQGANASALEKEIGPEQFPVNEHYFGLVNVSIVGTLPSQLWLQIVFKVLNVFHNLLKENCSFASVGLKPRNWIWTFKMVNKYKDDSSLLVIRETQIKNTMRYCFVTVGLAKIKKLTMPSICEEVEQCGRGKDSKNILENKVVLFL